jgi:2-polyprenyl-3-methyl-5-hydroxy-6-metoxy-1,4-benzoquinol methylase
VTLDKLETVEIACNLCGSREAQPLCVNCALKVVYCRGCGLVFVNPQPTEQALRQHHAASELLSQDGWSSYFDHSQEQIRELWEERLNDLQRWKRGVDLSLLDVGAGYGDFLHYVSRLGWQVSGFEFSRATARVSQQKYGIPLAVGDLFEMPFSDRSFDIITMWHVLEHMREPLPALQCCRELLTPQGILAIEVPNLNFLVRKSYRVPFSVVLHLYHFSSATLTALVRKAGFEVLECHQGNTGFQYSHVWKIYAKKCLYAFSRVVERLSGFNVGDSIRLYAKKATT